MHGTGRPVFCLLCGSFSEAPCTRHSPGRERVLVRIRAPGAVFPLGQTFLCCVPDAASTPLSVRALAFLVMLLDQEAAWLRPRLFVRGLVHSRCSVSACRAGGLERRDHAGLPRPPPGWRAVL